MSTRPLLISDSHVLVSFERVSAPWDFWPCAPSAGHANLDQAQSPIGAAGEDVHHGLDGRRGPDRTGVS